LGKKPRPNLQDVARHAGVSPATVSRVIHNTAHVRDSVQARVLESAASLGYALRIRPGVAAPQTTIAVLVTDILNPFFPEIVRGVQDEAKSDGLAMLLCDTSEDSQSERQVLDMLASRPVDGIIVCASRLAAEDLIALHERHTTPMVVINRIINHPGIPCILVDLENATYRAARHLLALNHTRIAYLAGPGASEASQARRRGLELALTEAGLCLRSEWCPSGFPNVDGGFQAMSALLAMPAADRPTAALAYNDMMAMGALHAIRAHHLRVPQDISLVGFDDIAMAAHTNPPLTTVDQPKYRMGKLAMQMLRQLMQGQAVPGEGYTLVESPLIVRESTAPLAGSNGHSPAGK
jgi:DNA-binding LacI/PurR family transcriptional regulator